MRIATFNVQNLRLRVAAAGRHFDGARDDVRPPSKLNPEERALDLEDRALTAQLIAEADADVLALQEVFDQRTLDAFHDAYLVPRSARYPHRICVKGNDGMRHVAFLSRLPLRDVRSNAGATYADLGLAPPPGPAAFARAFRRDCLTAVCGGVRLFNVHFKAPTDPASLAVAALEAQAVRRLVERSFPDPSAAHWLVLGDVNLSDVPSGDILAVLTEDFAVDLGAALPPEARWTMFEQASGRYLRPDRILASPTLAPRCCALAVRREGMSRIAEADSGSRFERVGQLRPHASDHALLSVEFV